MPAEETGMSPKTQSKIATGVCQAIDGTLSPGFRSVAALAGWDEESLLAGLVVEDTPERDGTKHRKRSVHTLRTPPTDSRRKKRARKSNAVSAPIVVLRLDDDETPKEGPGAAEEDGDESKQVDNESSKAPPCMDKLREELSCAICLEICFEPSTTPCGHSFCLKCLKCAAAKCGKQCPKCRQPISNGRACTVNTVLWNTIQLLFPKEVEGRRAAGASNRQTDAKGGQDAGHDGESRRRSGGGGSSSFVLSSELVGQAETTSRRRTTQAVESMGRRTVSPTQSEDAALALRLQREEFMRSVVESRRRRRRRRRSMEMVVEDRGRSSSSTSSVHSARASLRAMAFRAVRIRGRSRHS